jgi:hypothetical protein
MLRSIDGDGTVRALFMGTDLYIIAFVIQVSGRAAAAHPERRPAAPGALAPDSVRPADIRRRP